MKREKLFLKSFFVFFIFLCSSPLLAKQNETMYVAVQKAELKSSNKKTARTEFTLNYAEKVKILEEKKSWAYICTFSDDEIKGWIPLASLSKRRLIPNSTVTADAEELALAGKGFNKAIEAKYFEDSTEILQKVDLVEENKVSTEEIVSFLEEGNLNN